jgi:PilZ domain-containing protein
MICQPLNPPQRLLSLPSPESIRCPMDDEARRLEDRSPVHVTVDLSGLDIHTVAQQGLTENVSARGARVVTSKPWQPNDHVTVRSLLGSLRSRARVVYCQPLGQDTFAIGLELVVSAGEWTLPQTAHRHQA